MIVIVESCVEMLCLEDGPGLRGDMDQTSPPSTVSLLLSEVIPTPLGAWALFVSVLFVVFEKKVWEKVWETVMSGMFLGTCLFATK